MHENRVPLLYKGVLGSRKDTPDCYRCMDEIRDDRPAISAVKNLKTEMIPDNRHCKWESTCTEDRDKWDGRQETRGNANVQALIHIHIQGKRNTVIKENVR